MLSLQEMSDRIEISMMLDRYAGAIDRVDMDLLDTVFTPDAWVDYTAFVEGMAADYPTIRRWLGEGLSQSLGHQHIICNKEIVLDGDHGTGRVLCLNPMTRPELDAAGRPCVGFHGLWYLDEYVRTPNGWRISRRKEERSFSHNFPGEIPRRAERAPA